MAELVVLHTSDWHLGHQLYKKKRDAQFAAFLDWLINTINEQKVDVLIIAGDVFDTGLPGSVAQKLYYDFLGKAARSHCRHIVITAGNHDSPSFLTAPRRLLQSLNIIVVGAAAEPAEQVFALRDAAGSLEMIVCAVPYLRERDVRLAVPGESPEDKEAGLLSGIAAHYAAAAQKAQELREQENSSAPILATGHLFSVGATIDQGGEHELYAGSLGAVPASAFPSCLDYVALGHLHRAQVVGGDETRRYAGSPLPMSFDEARSGKGVALVRFGSGTVQVETLPVPQFQQFVSITGSRQRILAELARLKSPSLAQDEEIWVEVSHDGSDVAGDLNNACKELVQNSNLQILCVHACHSFGSMARQQRLRKLEDFSFEDVFQLLLDRNQKLSPDEKMAMQDVFGELLQLYRESKREN